MQTVKLKSLNVRTSRRQEVIENLFSTTQHTNDFINLRFRSLPCEVITSNTCQNGASATSILPSPRLAHYPIIPRTPLPSSKLYLLLHLSFVHIGLSKALLSVYAPRRFFNDYGKCLASDDEQPAVASTKSIIALATSSPHCAATMSLAQLYSPAELFGTQQ